MENKQFLSLIFFLFGLTINLPAQIVNIPDANFKTYLVNNSDINTNGDGEIQETEAEAFDGHIDCSSNDISSLVGLEAFIELDKLSCINNNLTEIDLSQNIKLTRLSCYVNSITNLDISKLVNLEYLNAHTNLLTELDVSKNEMLKDLYIQNNDFSSLDLTDAEQLKNLVVYNNNLTSVDLSLLPNLNQLSISTNPISSIDLSHNPLLSTLKTANLELTELDLSNNQNLTRLECDGNDISEIDFSNNSQLTYLDCGVNQFQELKLDSLFNLLHLFVNDNELKELDLSHLSALVELGVNDNALTFLNIATGNNEEMDYFNAKDNPDLVCIDVDDIDFALTSGWTIDETSNYSEDCSTFTAVYLSKLIEEISLSPNPAYDQLFIRNNEVAIQSVSVFDNTGRLQQTVLENDGMLDVFYLDSGLYTLQIAYKNGKKQTKRFVKL